MPPSGILAQLRHSTSTTMSSTAVLEQIRCGLKKLLCLKCAVFICSCDHVEWGGSTDVGRMVVFTQTSFCCCGLKFAFTDHFFRQFFAFFRVEWLYNRHWEDQAWRCWFCSRSVFLGQHLLSPQRCKTCFTLDSDAGDPAISTSNFL